MIEARCDPESRGVIEDVCLSPDEGAELDAMHQAEKRDIMRDAGLFHCPLCGRIIELRCDHGRKDF